MGLFSSSTETARVPKWQKKIIARGEFSPYTMRTTAGTTSGGEREGGAPTVELDPQLEALRQQGFGGAGSFFERAGDSFNRPVGQSQGFGNVDQLTQARFDQQRALLEPAFQQQQAQLKEGLFGSGRLGLQLASQGAGAGQGGFVNPDAFGLARAQSQTLSQAAQDARAGALAEEQTRFTAGLQGLTLDEQLQQQRQAGLFSMGTGMLGLGTRITDMESNLMKMGLDAETARVLASQGASGAATAAQNAAANSTTTTEGLGSSLLGSAVSAFSGSKEGAAAIKGGLAKAGTAILGWLSDENLKENIEVIGKLGPLDLVSWTWNKVANGLGLKGDSLGVIAQDVKKIAPECVGERDGYLTVNYSGLVNKLVGGQV